MHNRKRGNIDRRDFERALLTDTVPTDVPIVFSNDGFHANVRRATKSEALEKVIAALIRNNLERYTIPYRYRIRLSSTTSRQLSLAHPAAQYRACGFYKDYAHLIPYFCRQQDVSLRRPVKVGSTFFFFNRSADRKQYKGAAIDMLLHDETVRNPGSFFAYDGYDRLYKFYNSQEFVDLEKRFSKMRLTDVSKCFSSIYSHTLAWAVKDVQHGKEATAAVSFANDFDALMQYSNYSETNGIPVGAEVSRIFAEIILQSAEAAAFRKIQRHAIFGVDYVFRRYVDDYIIFANDPEILDLVQRSLADALLLFNLHLNEAKTHTIERPLQTRRSQIISGAIPAIERFRDAVLLRDDGSRSALPRRIGNPASLLRSFVNDVKVACVNGEAGYEDVSDFIVGSICSSIEGLIEGNGSASSDICNDKELYAKAFDALLSALYYFFVVHATVTTSYKVAKATILSVRFFTQKLPEGAPYIYERVRSLIQDALDNPSLLSVAMTECVPIEMLNIVLASSVLPRDYQTTFPAITDRVLNDDGPVDYFSIVSLLFYFGPLRPEFATQTELKLRRDFLPHARPLQVAHDAHLLLDLIACPHLSRAFKRECAQALLEGLNLSPARLFSNEFVREIEQFPWFVDWGQIDLLNHLAKKELRQVY